MLRFQILTHFFRFSSSFFFRRGLFYYSSFFLLSSFSDVFSLYSIGFLLKLRSPMSLKITQFLFFFSFFCVCTFSPFFFFSFLFDYCTLIHLTWSSIRRQRKNEGNNKRFFGYGERFCLFVVEFMRIE